MSASGRREVAQTKYNQSWQAVNNLGYNNIGDDGCQHISKLKAPMLKILSLCNMFMIKGKTRLETKDASGYHREDGLSSKYYI